MRGKVFKKFSPEPDRLIFVRLFTIMIMTGEGELRSYLQEVVNDAKVNILGFVGFLPYMPFDQAHPDNALPGWLAVEAVIGERQLGALDDLISGNYAEGEAIPLDFVDATAYYAVQNEAGEWEPDYDQPVDLIEPDDL